MIRTTKRKKEKKFKKLGVVSIHLQFNLSVYSELEK